MTRSRDGLFRREHEIFAFRYKTKDGHWKEKSTGTANREKACEFKREWDEANRHDTLPTEKAKWTVLQAATLWVEQHSARLTSEKAKRNERSYLRQLTKRLGERKLGSIALDDLKDYQQRRRREVRERPINLELQILIGVLKEANLWAPIGEHYKRLKEPESEVGQALSLNQLRRLETIAAGKDTWQIAYSAEVLAANTGLRGGEIKRLRLGMLDLESRRIRITRETTKTNAGARLVELNQSALEAACKLYRRAELLGASDPNHYLLPADLSRHTKVTDPLKGGRGFDPTRHQMSWDTAWRNLRKAAGFDKVRFHDLRHTFISMMGERGVPLPVVQAMVGHMSSAMVRYYTHISNSAAREAVEILDQMRKSSPLVGVLVGESPIGVESKRKLLN